MTADNEDILPKASDVMMRIAVAQPHTDQQTVKELRCKASS